MAAAGKALTELTEISSQVRSAVLFDAAGKVLASTLTEERGRDFADAAKRLLDQAKAVRDGEQEVNQLEARTQQGSVFVVRQGEHIVAAVTGPDPTAGLVFYDLKSCLRGVVEKPKAKRAPAKGKAAPAKGKKTSGSS